MSSAKGRLSGLLALSPILVFLLVYLLSSVFLGDFYKVPVSGAFLLASAYAFLISPGTVDDRVTAFSFGASDRNILLMVWIFLLAGAFAESAREIGAIDATVNLTLKWAPVQLILPGLFLTACFVSMAIGTSVGTIVAMVPLASGIAVQTGMNQGLMTALIVGGSFFGDNMSFISDTTIAATRAVDCQMNEKFKANFIIVLPAVIFSTVLYTIIGWNTGAAPDVEQVEWLKLIPYISVIVMAICGMKVVVVLAVGIALNAVIGFWTGALDWASWLSSLGNGMAGMGDLVIVTLLAGGMLGLITENGGLKFIMDGFMRHVKRRRGAEFSIGLITGAANLCTANNTIAIITVGRIVKDISVKFNISPRRAASLMDISSCVVQGIIPYGAQLLMAASLTGLTAFDILPYLYYQYAIAACLVLSIAFKGK